MTTHYFEAEYNSQHGVIDITEVDITPTTKHDKWGMVITRMGATANNGASAGDREMAVQIFAALENRFRPLPAPSSKSKESESIL